MKSKSPAAPAETPRTPRKIGEIVCVPNRNFSGAIRLDVPAEVIAVDDLGITVRFAAGSSATYGDALVVDAMPWSERTYRAMKSEKAHA